MAEKQTAKEYLKSILADSEKYLSKILPEHQLQGLTAEVLKIDDDDLDSAIKKWIDIYVKNIKELYQSDYTASNPELSAFLDRKDSSAKIVWGDCLDVLKAMPSESVGLMVTSPPYYNAREYSTWSDLKEYLNDMRLVIREAYRVLDNHRVFVFNVGDIFDNDNLTTKSTWGKRRIPLGAYFTQIFEEEGFTFVDDFIWDKGEVQSQRQKNGNNPYPFYQYPVNCYEHILIFHKHRIDPFRYPCPVCGFLQVNGNAYSEIGVKSWECKNPNCFKRSNANRGKRFSLKSMVMQSNHTAESMISPDFVAKWRRDIIKISPVIKINSKGENILGHTAPFPYEIPEFAVKMFSYPADIVLDPFAGSFTSVIAAVQNNRIGVGIELNKTMFYESSMKNLENKLPEENISEFDYEYK